MPNPVAIGTHAIVPHNDIAKVLRFRSRLGSGKSGGDGAYAIIKG